jgi:fatty acid desaturase
MMALQGIYPQAQSFTFLLRTRPGGYHLQLLVLAAHHLLLIGSMVALIGPLASACVAFLAYCFFGIHMSLAFITNHTAMPLTSEGPIELSFIETQLRTTRNVETNRLGDLLYGGLQYQIEHHIFPALPRPNLRQASAIIRRHLADAGLAYDVSDLRRTYGDILRHMRSVAATV